MPVTGVVLVGLLVLTAGFFGAASWAWFVIAVVAMCAAAMLVAVCALRGTTAGQG